MNDPRGTSPVHSSPSPVEALDPTITSIQPGGGLCMRLELAWGHIRRAMLKWFFPAYLRRMAARRLGESNSCPFEVLDPRDVKFYRNQGGYSWRPEDDPFAWRERLPVARVGLCELLVIGGGFLMLAVALAIWDWRWSVVPAGLALFVVSFFRNPRRQVPTEPGLVVSPADGKVVSIEEFPHDEFVGGPAVQIGIFLSVFNVHLNRMPVAARVLGLTYRRGKFLNALRPESARENEQMAVRIEEPEAPYRRMIVRQIAGAIARRIVCWLAPGDVLERGAQFGMIKLGSRTELVLPKEAGMEICVQVGQHVKAGETVFVRYGVPR